jgi:hypothetical protein
MYQELTSIANELDRRGLTKEAGSVDLLLKLAQATGRKSALKILLKQILENHGYSVSDNPGEADIHLDTKSNNWGNLNEAWFAFGKHVLEIDEVATQWVDVASKLGTGYKPTIGGMMDLLQDFAQGGRFQVGGNLGTLGQGGLAEQTKMQQDSIESQRTVNTALEPFGSTVEALTGKDSTFNRSHDFRETREEAEAQARAVAKSAEEPPVDDMTLNLEEIEGSPGESGPNAYRGQ